MIYLVNYFVKVMYLIQFGFNFFIHAGLGDMHLCDEVGFNFRLPVDEMCLIPAIPLDEITE